MVLQQQPPAREAPTQTPALGPDNTPFWLGQHITSEQVNFNGNYPLPGGKKSACREPTLPRQYLPKASGFGGVGTRWVATSSASWPGFLSLLLPSQAAFRITRAVRLSLMLTRHGMQPGRRAPATGARCRASVSARGALPAAPRTTPWCKAGPALVSGRTWCRG